MRLEQMYQDVILDHYKHPHHRGLREPFGAERLYEVVRTNASSTADQILGAIDDATAAHAGSHEQEDDFTAISVRVLPR